MISTASQTKNILESGRNLKTPASPRINSWSSKNNEKCDKCGSDNLTNEVDLIWIEEKQQCEYIERSDDVFYCQDCNVLITIPY